MKRTIVITGGTGGLGTALARRLVGTHQMAVSYIMPEEARAFEAEVEAAGADSASVMLRRVDANEASEVEAFMADAAERFGTIEGLASLVGGWAGGRDVEGTDNVRFDRMIDLNLRSAFYAVRAALPYLRQAEAGRIVLVGSRAAIDGPAGQSAFNIAKAGVVALGRSTAQELEDTGATANVVMPSLIDTPATRTALPFADYVKWPSPDEMAPVIEFLLSPDSGVISGAVIPCYGSA